jgi:hypothetical protein
LQLLPRRLLLLRRLDEIERKLDRMMEELRPTAIGYSVRRGNRPKEGLSSPCGRIRGMVRFLRRHGRSQGQALTLGGVAETFVALNRGPLVEPMDI